MTLPTKPIQSLVDDMVAAWGANTGITPNFSSGDILLAMFQAIAGQLDFLQAQVQVVLALTRASSSSGADLDSWMAQFKFSRLVATYATTTVVFSRRLAASAPILVPVGTIIQTAGGKYQYKVVADTNVASFDSTQNGYVLPIGSTSVTATVEATVGGAGANVVTGAISQFATSLAGVDFVTNPQPVTDGYDAESDDAYRARFPLYLATMSKATRNAIYAAAMGVQQGLSVNLLENQTSNGAILLGSFTAVVDDGSGAPPTTLINNVFDAVNATRAFTVQPFVVAPTTIIANIVITVRLAPNTVSSLVNPLIQQAIAGIVNERIPGTPLYASDVDAAAKLVTGVVAVRSGTTINGIAADLIPTASQEIRTTVTNINVENY